MAWVSQKMDMVFLSRNRDCRVGTEMRGGMAREYAARGWGRTLSGQEGELLCARRLMEAVVSRVRLPILIASSLPVFIKE